VKKPLEIPVYLIRKGATKNVGALGLEGANLAKEFLDELAENNPKGHQILQGQIKFVADFLGVPRNSRIFKPLDLSRQLYEFHPRTGLRLYCFLDGTSLIILTNGGVKGPRREQNRDIARAKDLQDKYLELKANGAKVKLIEPDSPT
jgi:hypothetical protein